MNFPSLLAISLIVSSGLSAQRVFEVPSPAAPTVQAAVTAAEDGDTIRIVGEFPTSVSASLIDLLGKRLTIEGRPDRFCSRISVVTGPAFQVTGGQPVGTLFRNICFSSLVDVIMTISGSGQNVANLRFENCIFTSNGPILMTGPACDLTFVGCTFQSPAERATMIQAMDGVPGSNAVRSRLRFERCRFRAGQDIPPSPTRGAGAFRLTGNLSVEFDSCSFQDCISAIPQVPAGALLLETNSNGVGPEVSLVHCTISASQPQAVWMNGGSLAIRHSILWENEGTSWLELGANTTASLDLFNSNLQGGIPASSPGLTIQASQILEVDPMFWDNSGSSPLDPLFPDGSLRAGSPMIDRGDPARDPLGLDAESAPRVQDGDRDGVFRADLGAHEFRPVHMVQGEFGGNPRRDLVIQPVVQPEFDVVICFPVTPNPIRTFLPELGLLLIDPQPVVELMSTGGAITIAVPTGSPPFRVLSQGLVLATERSTGQTWLSSTKRFAIRIAP